MTNSITKHFLLFVGLLLFAIPASAQKDGAWTGEIVDLACYEQNKSINEGYRACVEKGVKNGQPMGIVTADNKMAVLAASEENEEAYQSLTKTAYGPVLKGGVVFEVEVTVTSKDSKGRTVIGVGNFKMLR